MWGCVVFCVEANLFADWLCGNAFPFERKQIRLLFEIESMRYLLSWNRFVCRLSMWGCVPFWVEADSLPNWVCGDVFAFEWKQIRFLIEKWGCVSFWVEANTLLFEIEEVRYLLSWNRFVCRLSMWGCVPFWVEADSLPNWVCGDALAFE